MPTPMPTPPTLHGLLAGLIDRADPARPPHDTPTTAQGAPS